MQIVHEFGHVLGAWVSGGDVARVVLHPLVISRTDLGRNPHPLFVTWAGPVVGAALLVLVLLAARVCRAPGLYLCRFFAGFCLIANGIYIGVGGFVRAGDAGDLLRHGSPHWQLVLFGLITVPLGLYLWHGLGPSFGLGEGNGKVSRPAAIFSAALFLAVVAAELLIAYR